MFNCKMKTFGLAQWTTMLHYLDRIMLSVLAEKTVRSGVGICAHHDLYLYRAPLRTLTTCQLQVPTVYMLKPEAI